MIIEKFQPRWKVHFTFSYLIIQLLELCWHVWKILLVIFVLDPKGPSVPDKDWLPRRSRPIGWPFLWFNKVKFNSNYKSHLWLKSKRNPSVTLYSYTTVLYQPRRCEHIQPNPSLTGLWEWLGFPILDSLSQVAGSELLFLIVSQDLMLYTLHN